MVNHSRVRVLFGLAIPLELYLKWSSSNPRAGTMCGSTIVSVVIELASGQTNRFPNELDGRVAMVLNGMG